MEGQCGGVGSNEQVIEHSFPMAEEVASTLSRQRAWGQQLEATQQEDARERAAVAEEAEGRTNVAADDSVRQRIDASPQSKEQQRVTAAKEAEEKVEKAKKAAQFARTVLRVINGVEIVSIWGVLLAVITMHYQLIFGNLLNGAILPAPKLDWWEIAILFILDILVAIVVGVIVVIVYYLLNPLELLKEVPGTLNPFNGAGGVVNGQVIAPRAWR